MGFQDKLVSPALRINDAINKLPKTHNVYFITAISCVAGMMFGFDLSSMSAYISTTPYLNYFDHPSSVMQGFITASMSLGSFFGSIIATFVSEPFGRRISLIVCSLLWCIGAAIQASSINRAQLIVGRIISGLAIGFGTTVAPVYGSELAPRRIRGRIGAVFQFNVALGMLIMYFIAFGCSYIDGIGSFRLGWALQVVPGISLFTGCLFIPESPRWLAKQGSWSEAEEIVAKIQAKGDTQDPEVLVEIAEIKEQIYLEEKLKSFTYADLFRKKYLARTITAMSAQIWQQLTGTNTMLYYITYIFDMAGFTGNTNLVASAIQYVIFVLTTAPGLVLLDKIGRRKILMIGGVLMAMWQFCVAGLLAQYSVPYPDSPSSTVTIRIPESEKPAANAVIACCYLFVASYAVTWGVGIWGYCAEIWGDNSARQRGAAVSTASNWIFNFSLAMYTPSAFQNINWKTYCIFATFCICMTIHVYFGFPETRGKRLEEIAQIWDDKIPAWKTSKWQPHIAVFTEGDPEEISSKYNITYVENANPIEPSNSHSSGEKEAGR